MKLFIYKLSFHGTMTVFHFKTPTMFCKCVILPLRNTKLAGKHISLYWPADDKIFKPYPRKVQTIWYLDVHETWQNSTPCCNIRVVKEKTCPNAFGITAVVKRLTDR